MSNASQHAAHIVAESVYGETPATPPFSRLRHTGMTLGVQRGSMTSEELRPDRQISDFRLGAVTVAGDVQTELSYGTYDALLEAVLLGTWAAKSTITATTLSVANADSSFNDSANGFDTVNLQVGDKLDVSGFGTGGNNGAFKIVSVAAGKIIVTNDDGTPAVLVDEAAGASATIESQEDVLKAGTTRRSFSILRHFTDIAATGEGLPYHLFKGVEFNTLALAVNPTAIVTASFGTMGREGASPSNDAPAGATFAAATTTAVLDAFTGELLEGGSPVGVISEFSVNLENGLEARPVVGSKLTIEPSIGRSNLTGSATVYFEDSSFVKKFVEETETSLSIELPDGEGNSYIVKIPKLKFTNGQPDVSGQGSVTLNMPFQGIFDETTGTNISIHRIPA